MLVSEEVAFGGRYDCIPANKVSAEDMQLLNLEEELNSA